LRQRIPSGGPLLIIWGELDHTVPPSVVKAAHKQQRDNEGVTEFIEIKNRGHGLTIDSGWREGRHRARLREAVRLAHGCPSGQNLSTIFGAQVLTTAQHEFTGDALAAAQV
jgi:hypothetical protein